MARLKNALRANEMELEQRDRLLLITYLSLITRHLLALRANEMELEQRDRSHDAQHNGHNVTKTTTRNITNVVMHKIPDTSTHNSHDTGHAAELLPHWYVPDT